MDSFKESNYSLSSTGRLLSCWCTARSWFQSEDTASSSLRRISSRNRSYQRLSPDNAGQKNLTVRAISCIWQFWCAIAGSRGIALPGCPATPSSIIRLGGVVCLGVLISQSGWLTVQNSGASRERGERGVIIRERHDLYGYAPRHERYERRGYREGIGIHAPGISVGIGTDRY